MRKIEELTSEQDALLGRIASEWEDSALGEDDSYSVSEIVRGVDWLYSEAGLKPPGQVVICPGPADMVAASELPKGETFDCLGVGYDSGWTSWAEAAQQIGVDFEPEWGFERWRDWLLKSGAWATLLYEHVAFICIRPCRVRRTVDGDLHCEDGPAIAWRDGCEMHFLHGVPVSKDLVETPASDLDPGVLLREKNAEVRREIVRKIGMDRIIADLGGETVDAEDDYELLLFDLGDGRRRPFLKMKNPSIGVWHVEGVPPEIQSVEAALAWRNGRNDRPEVLT